jgi:23S rRNA (uracil1939-C5)-methyltransferase
VKSGTVELHIERIVAGGAGLARTPDGAVFVRGALPGERVTARPSLRAGVLRAHVIDILDPHPGRVAIPDAPPGADLPLIYGEQLAVKEGLVREALERVAKLEHDLAPIHPSPHELAYRTAAQYAVVEGGGLGARAIDSDRVVPLAADALVTQPIAAAFATCSSRALHGVTEVSFRASLHEQRVLVALHGERRSPAAERLARALEDSGAAGVSWAQLDERGRFRGRTTVMNGHDRLLEDFGGVLSTITVRSFAQVNPPAAGAMYREAATLAGSGSRALDLYAGSGVLGLHLAAAFDDVVAVEIAPDAVRRGEADARRLGRPLRFHRGDARSAARYLPADLVALDPPRAGLADDVIRVLGDHRPPRMVYASCDPTTWARDVGKLAGRGYRLTFARPYDFYPYTSHVEVLSVLEI